jgi:hypothetical protein
MVHGSDDKVDIDPERVRQAALTVAMTLARAAAPATGLPIATGLSPADAAAAGLAAAIAAQVATSSAELAPKGPVGQAQAEAAVGGFESTDAANTASLAGVDAQATVGGAAAAAPGGGAGGAGGILSTFGQVLPALAQLANPSTLAGMASAPASALMGPMSGMTGGGAPMSPPTTPTPTPSPLPPYQDKTGQIQPRSGPYDPPVPEPEPTYGPPALPPYDPSGPTNDGSYTTAPGGMGPYGYYEKVPGSGQWFPPPPAAAQPGTTLPA